METGRRAFPLLPLPASPAAGGLDSRGSMQFRYLDTIQNPGWRACGAVCCALTRARALEFARVPLVACPLLTLDAQYFTPHHSQSTWMLAGFKR